MSRESFDRAVYALVRRIAAGSVVTYGQVAVLLGHPRAARAVGGAMRRCPAGVPWHRVVNAQGRISRRARAAGMLTQRLLLEREGVRLRRGRVDLARHRWDGVRSRRRSSGTGRAAARAAGGRAASVRAPLPLVPPGRSRARVLMIDDERAWRWRSS